MLEYFYWGKNVGILFGRAKLFRDTYQGKGHHLQKNKKQQQKNK